MILPPPPAELAHLAQKLGAAALFALMDAHGGTSLYIARTPRDGDELVRLVGMAPAQALAAEWGGNYLRVPLNKRWQARVLRAQGLTHANIARRMKCNENTVRLYLTDPGPSRQLALPV